MRPRIQIWLDVAPYIIVAFIFSCSSPQSSPTLFERLVHDMAPTDRSRVSFEQEDSIAELERMKGAKQELLESGSNAVPSLLNQLGVEKNPGQRTRIVQVLGLIKDRRAVSSLTKLLARSDTDRTWVAWALGEIADPTSFEPMRDTLRCDPDREVRDEAALALGKIGNIKAVPIVKDAVANGRVLKVYGIAAIVRLNKTEAIPMLHALVAGDDASDRHWAYIRLVELGEKEFAIPRMLADPEPSIREDAKHLQQSGRKP